MTNLYLTTYNHSSSRLRLHRTNFFQERKRNFLFCYRNRLESIRCGKDTGKKTRKRETQRFGNVLPGYGGGREAGDEIPLLVERVENGII